MDNFKEYVDDLVRLLKERPELGTLPMCYSSDDEGNNHCKGVFEAEPGVFEGDYNGDFTGELRFVEDEDDPEHTYTKDDINCVRIN